MTNITEASTWSEVLQAEEELQNAKNAAKLRIAETVMNAGFTEGDEVKFLHKDEEVTGTFVKYTKARVTIEVDGENKSVQPHLVIL